MKIPNFHLRPRLYESFENIVSLRFFLFRDQYGMAAVAKRACDEDAAAPASSRRKGARPPDSDAVNAFIRERFQSSAYATFARDRRLQWRVDLADELNHRAGDNDHNTWTEREITTKLANIGIRVRSDPLYNVEGRARVAALGALGDTLVAEPAGMSAMTTTPFHRITVKMRSLSPRFRYHNTPRRWMNRPSRAICATNKRVC